MPSSRSSSGSTRIASTWVSTRAAAPPSSPASSQLTHAPSPARRRDSSHTIALAAAPAPSGPRARRMTLRAVTIARTERAPGTALVVVVISADAASTRGGIGVLTTGAR
ncbi:MAG: hypothetical protein IPJ34_41475 [Myxococcales bacterium]|nr:hypothetical protein [Myxococcales bacterium]